MIADTAIPILAFGRRLAAAASLFALALAGPAAGQEAPELVLVRVPPPSLEGLEPAVKGQLQESAARLGRMPKEAGGETAASRRELAERFGELGHLYHAYELWPSAEAAYENARRLEPQEISWTWSLAVAAFKQGQSAKAEQLFAAALELAPEQPAAWLYLAEIALHKGDAAKAADLAAQVLAKVEASPAALFTFGRAAILAEHPKDAIPPLELAVEQVPEANRIHYLLAMAKRATGDLEGAKRHIALAGQVGVRIPDPLEAVLAEHRRGERVATVEGDLAMGAGRYAEAIAAYQRATAVQPKNAELWTRLGAARASAGELDAAEADLRRALEVDPFLQIGLLQLSRLLAFRQRHAEALPFLERLLDLDGGPAAHREMGLAQNALGRREAALGHLRKVVAATPADEEARLGAAVAAVELGLYREGRELLEQGLALDPGQGRLVRALARLLAAVPETGLRDGEQAVALAERLVRTTGLAQDEEILALALAEAGRCGEAADLLVRLAGEVPAAEAERRQSLAARAAEWRRGPPCRPPGR